MRPIGRRMSRFIASPPLPLTCGASENQFVPARRYYRKTIFSTVTHQHKHGEICRPLVPAQVPLAWLLRQRVYQPNEIALRAGASEKADCNRHHEADDPRPDGGPEVLRHVA